MNAPTSRLAFLGVRSVMILSGILIAESILAYTVANRTEQVPPSPPLKELPVTIGSWQLTQEGVVEKEVQDVLKADDVVTRAYASPLSQAGANLFVAYFRSQRSGKAPHSPKNCLPGSGWTQLRSGRIAIPIPDAAPLVVNRYVVAKGDNQSMVFYWYQSSRRVEASEYWAKIFLVLDAIRYNRSDTALVRVVVPISNGDQESAQRAGVDFVRAVFPQVGRHFPI
jgi:EpsI family protein